MRTVVRTKTINGIDYLYEITYYYDKASRRTRQHSQYLGRTVEGHPVRVRDVAGVPKTALNYGEFLPCFAASETYDLGQRLARYLSPNEVRAVLTLPTTDRFARWRCNRLHSGIEARSSPTSSPIPHSRPSTSVPCW